MSERASRAASGSDGAIRELCIPSSEGVTVRPLDYARPQVPRTRADIANTATRIFLQEFGVAYDEIRGFDRYVKSKHFKVIRDFFGDRCCYCGVDLATVATAQDHLIPLNQKDLGLHAWGNVVPSCSICNALKQGRPWHEVVAERAGEAAAERYRRIKEFVEHYRYDPPYDLREATADLYAEVGNVAMALIRTKIERIRAHS